MAKQELSFQQRLGGEFGEGVRVIGPMKALEAAFDEGERITRRTRSLRGRIQQAGHAFKGRPIPIVRGELRLSEFVTVRDGVERSLGEGELDIVLDM